MSKIYEWGLFLHMCFDQNSHSWHIKRPYYLERKLSHRVDTNCVYTDESTDVLEWVKLLP